MSSIIAAPERRIHEPLRVQVTGLHRGAEGSLPALGRLAKSSLRPIQAVGIDPYPGRANQYREAAKKHGLAVEPVQARYEAVADDAGLAVPDLHILHADDARTSQLAVERARARGHAVSGLLIANLPKLGLTAFRYTGREHALEATLRLLTGLALVASGRGSERFWGASAPLATRQSEGALRTWHSDYLERDVGRLLGGLTPTASPIEATSNGRVTRPVVVLEGEVLDDDSSSVARRVEEVATFPLRRHQPFVVVEIARRPEPVLRFRNGLVRADHLLQVGGAHDISKADMQRQADLARASAERPARNGESGGGLLLGLALGFALGAAIAGNATARTPIDLTD